MKRLMLFVCTMVCMAIPVRTQEVRGARLFRNERISRAKIASMMDSLANNNFNVAYVNAWSRGR
ncbi:MAG: hypothetical protein NTV54_09885 [Ignavibacteriales bacterium]|nr:hypothetical protein [Ignavibacteriales bacterium]